MLTSALAWCVASGKATQDGSPSAAFLLPGEWLAARSCIAVALACSSGSVPEMSSGAAAVQSLAAAGIAWAAASAACLVIWKLCVGEPKPERRRFLVAVAAACLLACMMAAPTVAKALLPGLCSGAP